MDRSFLAALSVSLACHVLFFSIQLIRLHRVALDTSHKALDVVYEAQSVAAMARELQGLRGQLTQMAGVGEAQAGVLPGFAAPTPKIRIPDRSMGMGGGMPSLVPDARLSRPAVVDLTNLVEAAQGNPVLLSYFSAIREQIQTTANRQAWQSGGTAQGLVYVSFGLSATGQVSSASVLSDRSTPSRFLQDVALNIIKASSPFPVFPPSFSASSRTIVVPLEFLVGSSHEPAPPR